MTAPAQWECHRLHVKLSRENTVQQLIAIKPTPVASGRQLLARHDWPAVSMEFAVFLCRCVETDLASELSRPGNRPRI